MQKQILFFGNQVIVACDQNCKKAWGVNSRPKNQLSEDPDDYEFLSDSELGCAPINPKTYEGGDAKPKNPNEFPNKWCVRECERCSMCNINKIPKLKNFDLRIKNINPH